MGRDPAGRIADRPGRRWPLYGVGCPSQSMCFPEGLEEEVAVDICEDLDFRDREGGAHSARSAERCSRNNQVLLESRTTKPE